MFLEVILQLVFKVALESLQRFSQPSVPSCSIRSDHLEPQRLHDLVRRRAAPSRCGLAKIAVDASLPSNQADLRSLSLRSKKDQKEPASSLLAPLTPRIADGRTDRCCLARRHSIALSLWPVSSRRPSPRVKTYTFKKRR